MEVSECNYCVYVFALMTYDRIGFFINVSLLIRANDAALKASLSLEMESRYPCVCAVKQFVPLLTTRAAGGGSIYYTVVVSGRATCHEPKKVARCVDLPWTGAALQLLYAVDSRE